MIVSQRSRQLAVAFILLVLGATSPAVLAQFNIDSALAQQDRAVLSYFSRNFARDHRSDKVFTRIYARLGPHLSEVYADPQKQVTPYVFAGNLGFNAMTWDHIIIFDSLLIDTFHRLSEAVVLYGGTNNSYCWNLARTVATLQTQLGRLPTLADRRSPDNLYHLPMAGTLQSREQAQADVLFEEMLASWLGHEGSHAFLNHARERMEAEAMRETAVDNNDGNALGTYINHYAATSNGADKEREADEKGALLITKAGYGIRGFVLTLEFARYLEEMTGMNAYASSHPPAEERIADIERVVGLGGLR